MDFDNGLIHQEGRLTINNFLPEIGKDQLRNNIIAGLEKNPKMISSMFFYDERGSEIYEEITHLPEYYPPRLERTLIFKSADYLKDSLQDHDIIELGSGDCSKISIFLDSLSESDISSIRYVPVDFSQSAIVKSAEMLVEKYHGIKVLGIVGDFLSHLETIPNGKERLFIFFGSTIGNLEVEDARRFFKDLYETMGPGDRMLIGMDMVKDKEVLEKAYNDSQGVTADFNRNIINVVNRLLDTTMDPNDFEHVAFFNEEKSRIEMHLQAGKEHFLEIPGREPIWIREGELIHTESSHKFTNDDIERMMDEAGLVIEKIFTDEDRWFSLILLGKQ